MKIIEKDKAVCVIMIRINALNIITIVKERR